MSRFDPESLREFLHQNIPLSQAMELAVPELSWDRITLSASLAANYNDKGTAFGGSLAALMTLAGWSLLLNRLESTQLDADLMVHSQSIEYRRPVAEDLLARSQLDPAAWDEFAATVARRGKARIELDAVIECTAGEAAARMQARYVALLKGYDSHA